MRSYWVITWRKRRSLNVYCDCDFCYFSMKRFFLLFFFFLLLHYFQLHFISQVTIHQQDKSLKRQAKSHNSNKQTNKKKRSSAVTSRLTTKNSYDGEIDHKRTDKLVTVQSFWLIILFSLSHKFCNLFCAQCFQCLS